MRKLILLGTLLFSIAVSNAQDTVSDYILKTVNDIPTTGVRDQHRSGTCWAFAATSFIETELLRMGQGKIDLSEMYFVRDAYIDKAVSYVQMHGASNFSPGGQAHDVMHTIRKKGMITEEAYNGLKYGLDKHNHSELNSLLKAQVSVISKNKSGKINPSWLNVVKATLDEYLGEVPEKFSFKGDKVTPEEFVESTSFNPDDYVEITSYTHHPYYEAFRLEVPDNWTYDNYYNVPINELMEIINYSFNEGYSVCWDGDVSEKGFSHTKGVATVPKKKEKDREGTEMSKWADVSEKNSKSEKKAEKKIPEEKQISQEDRQSTFTTHQSTDDHLMHLTGIVKDQNGTKFYITKNSWDDDSNDFGGFLYMSEQYLRLNTIAIMVHKDAIPKKTRKKLDL